MTAVLFPFRPDWSEKVSERIQYLTKVFTARSRKEQRVQMRSMPRRALAFTVWSESEQESQYLDSILAASQAKLFAIPWWPDSKTYAGSLSAGATSIAIPTDNALFGSAPLLVVWSTPFLCEVCTVTSFASGLVGISALVGSYQSPQVLPAFMARMNLSQATSRETSNFATAPIEFQTETVP